MTKNEITKKLNEYKKAGWLVFCWNDRRAVPSGAKGWADHVLIHPRLCIFLMLEIKLGKDVLTKKQSELLIAISDNDEKKWTVRYWTPNEQSINQRLKDIDRITERGDVDYYVKFVNTNTQNPEAQ